MAGYIEDRWLTKKPDPATGKRKRTDRYGKGKRYRVAGIPGVRDMSFHVLEDAKAWLKQAATDKRRGQFVDPRDGDITLADYIEQHWWPSTTYPPSSRSSVRSRVWTHIIPFIGDLALNTIDNSALRTWNKGVLGRVDTTTARTIWAHLRTILQAAVEDERLLRNPAVAARTVKPPAKKESKAQALPRARVDAIRDALTDRYQLAVDLGVGIGLRQGEAFGLGEEDIDFQAGIVHVRRQLQLDEKGRPYLSLPKGNKTREISAPPRLLARIRDALQRFPAVSTTLPWSDPEPPETDLERKQRKPITVKLVLTSSRRTPIRYTNFNETHWKPALEAAGIITRVALTESEGWTKYGDTREWGFHVLRHTFASVTLEAGESVVTLSKWLGHHSVKVTLDHYAHFLPEAGRKGLAAMDAWFAAPQTLDLPRFSPGSVLISREAAKGLVAEGRAFKSGMNTQFKKIDFEVNSTVQGGDSDGGPYGP